MRITVVRASYGQYTDAFFKNGYVGIGWFDDPLQDITDKGEIENRYKTQFSDHTKMQSHQNVGQIYRFLNDVGSGSIVITPHNDNRLIIGKIESEPYFEKDDTSPFYYRRKVKWYKDVVDRHSYSIPLQNSLRSSLTVFNISLVREVLESVGEPIPKEYREGKTRLTFDDDGVYEAVKKQFLELDPKEFEQLVSYVLQSLGFEAKQETGGVGDGGVDFEGELNIMGIASINLQVQVKRFANATVGEKDIRSLRGALKKDYQGCFITLSSFNKKAKESALDPEKVAIKLINGRQFVELFIEQYEKIMDAIRNDDNDELADKLKFKRVLLPE